MDDVLKIGQVAEICHVSARTVAKWFDAGLLPGYRIPGGKDRRVQRKHLVRFMKEHHMEIPNFLDVDSPYRVLTVGFDLDTLAAFQGCLARGPKTSLQSAVSTFSAGILMETFVPDCLVMDTSIGRIETGLIVRTVRESPVHSGTILVALGASAPAGLDLDHFYKVPGDDLAVIVADIQELITMKREADLKKRSKFCHIRKQSSLSS